MSEAIRTKTIGLELAGGDGEGVHRFWVTTDAVDRDMEIIDPDGIDWGEFLKNPVVLFNHRAEIPVGRAVGLKREAREGKNGWTMGVEYADEIDEQAAKIRKMVDAGFLKTASIRFLVEPKGYEIGDIDKDGWQTRFTKTKAVEWSIVTLPANPQAERDKSVVKTLDDAWAEFKSLDVDGEPTGMADDLMFNEHAEIPTDKHGEPGKRVDDVSDVTKDNDEPAGPTIDEQLKQLSEKFGELEKRVERMDALIDLLKAEEPESPADPEKSQGEEVGQGADFGIFSKLIGEGTLRGEGRGEKTDSPESLIVTEEMIERAINNRLGIPDLSDV